MSDALFADPRARALRQVELLSHLPDSHIVELMNAGTISSVAAQDVVIRQGEPADALYVLLNGTVRVERQDGTGATVLLATLEAGSVFGEVALLDGSPRSATVVADTSCVFFVLARTQFFTLLGRSPDLVSAIVSKLTATIRENNDRAVQREMALHTLRTEMELRRHRTVSFLVAGVAHEINTPLGIIATAVSLLKRTLTAEAMEAAVAPDAVARTLLDDGREAALLVERNLDRAHKLIQDFKKVSVSQLHDTRERLDLAASITDIVHLFSLNAKRAKLDIRINDLLPAETRQWAGYLGALTQVVTNLLTNCERYAYPGDTGGKVDITLTADRESTGVRFRIRVRDFGQGIPPEHVPHVFDAFFTTGRSRGGTGLGLAIVHNLVTDYLRGTITIASTPGEGAEVLVTLPEEVPEPGAAHEL